MKSTTLLILLILAPVLWGQDLSLCDASDWPIEYQELENNFDEAWQDQQLDSAIYYLQSMAEINNNLQRWEAVNDNLYNISYISYIREI